MSVSFWVGVCLPTDAGRLSEDLIGPEKPHDLSEFPVSPIQFSHAGSSSVVAAASRQLKYGKVVCENLLR
jgi:hypothetical protein